MKYEPHNYQKYATRYIEKHPLSAVLLDMGLGKTSITLTALNDLRLMSFSPSDEFQPQDGQHTHGDRGDQDAVAELPFAAVPAVPPVVTATGCCRVRLFRHSLIEF